MFVSNTKETVKTYTKQYSGFKGVDFSSAITEVDDRRSPGAVNMIADFGGFPCKRTGYAILDSGFDGRINGIFKFIDAQSVKRMVIHAGTKIYSYIETAPILQPNPPTSYVYSSRISDASCTYLEEQNVNIACKCAGTRICTGF